MWSTRDLDFLNIIGLEDSFKEREAAASEAFCSYASTCGYMKTMNSNTLYIL